MKDCGYPSAANLTTCARAGSCCTLYLMSVHISSSYHCPFLFILTHISFLWPAVISVNVNQRPHKALLSSSHMSPCLPNYQGPHDSLFTRAHISPYLPGPTSVPVYQGPHQSLFTRAHISPYLPGPTSVPIYQGPHQSLFTRAHISTYLPVNSADHLKIWRLVFFNLILWVLLDSSYEISQVNVRNNHFTLHGNLDIYIAFRQHYN